MIEELLETFVGVVNAKLLKSVEVENFESSNIKHSAEETFWQIGRQCPIDNSDQVVEKTAEGSLGDCRKSIVTLIDSLTFCDIFISNSDLSNES